MSRYDLFRRRIAPVAFLLAIGLIARDSCEKDRRTHTTVELQLGDARPRVRAVDVDVVTGDQAVTRFHRAALPDTLIGPCRFDVALPAEAEDGQLRIDVDLGAEHRRLTRAYHAIEGATLFVPLEGDLAPR
ncbi:MAG TPA: hypothetical protein VHW23_19390 [Kofleriaceae bacterium]|nr:hypothetical protein [Kofleriaceae bacterium]